jgi:hypothetical protein
MRKPRLVFKSPCCSFFFSSSQALKNSSTYMTRRVLHRAVPSMRHVASLSPNADSNRAGAAAGTLRPPWCCASLLHQTEPHLKILEHRSTGKYECHGHLAICLLCAEVHLTTRLPPFVFTGQQGW